MRRALQYLSVLAGYISAQYAGLVDSGETVLDHCAAHGGDQARGMAVYSPVFVWQLGSGSQVDYLSRTHNTCR